MKKIGLMVLFFSLLLHTGCMAAPAAETEQSEIFTHRDLDGSYRAEDCTRILLSGDRIQVEGSGALVEGRVLSIHAPGSYLLSGTLENGCILVDVEKDEKVQLVLNGVSICSEDSAPLYIRQADKVFVTLAENTENALTNGGSFAGAPDSGVDAVLFSREDLTLNGSGSLKILSPAGHGIVSKDSLRVTGGSLTVDAASHGLSANDEISICTAEFNVQAGKDGIHSENEDDTEKGFVLVESGSFAITAAGDGIRASASMEIRDGVFDLCCGGGSENDEEKTSDFPGGFGPGPHGRGQHPPMMEPAYEEETDSVSSKGLKAASLQISGGSFSLDCADDALHSDTSMTVSGGSFAIRSGDDALHADESLSISGGTFDIADCYEGLEALHLEISGGELQLCAEDDGLNAAGGMDQSGFGGPRGGDPFGGGSQGSIVISGGTLDITASGDGLDANGSIEITGGFTTVCGPSAGDTATLDYDTTAVIRGGGFFGTGGAGMAQTFSEATQGLLALRVGQQSAGTKIEIYNQQGETILSRTPALPYAVVIVSSPELTAGESYTVMVGESSGSFSA